MDSPRRSTLVWKDQHDFQADELERFLFAYEDWIHPWKYEDFKGKDVLDAGSGPGIQARLIAEHARHVTAVDLEAIETTRARTTEFARKMDYVQADIAKMDLGREFDVVNCVGVIHHTDDPTSTFRNLAKHTRVGGVLILWAYAREGNLLMRSVVEPLRQRFLSKLPYPTLWSISCAVNALLYPIVHTLYRLPLRFLPYYDYFRYYRRMSFKRTALDICDKLNAPQQHFIDRATIRSWFNDADFEDVHVSMYKGVSWRASGRKKAPEEGTG